MSTSTFQPYGIGLKYSPPSLFVFYESEIGKRRRKIPLRTIQSILKTKDSKPIDLDSYASFLISNYTQHLSKVSRIQLQNILQKLLSHHNLTAASVVAAAPVSAPSVQAIAKADLPSLPAKTLDLEKNLNKASDEELDRAKRLMEVSFEKNRVTKDSADFQYDIKKDFGAPTMSNEWDSSDEEESKGKQGTTTSASTNIPVKPQPLKSTTTGILKKESQVSPPISAAPTETGPPKEPVKHLSGLAPLPQSISKKEKQSLADDLDSLLDSFESDEKKDKPKKSTKKVKIVSEKKDVDEKVASTTKAPKEQEKSTEKLAGTPNLDSAPPKTELPVPSKPLEPISKPLSLLGGLPPLTSLSGLPPLAGAKTLPLPSKTLALAAQETVAPRNSFTDIKKDADVLSSPLAASPVIQPVIQPSRVVPKSAFHDEIIDDISEEIILDGDDDEDEEFANLRQKLAEVSKERQNDDVKKATNVLPPNDPVKPSQSASLVPLPASTPLSALASSSAPLAPLSSPSPLPAPISSSTPAPLAALSAKSAVSNAVAAAAPKPSDAIPSAQKPAAKPSSNYDYEDDFEAGHTDDEIVFSDDGLSIGSADKDDFF